MASFWNPTTAVSNGTLVVSLMQKNRRERAAGGNKIIGYRLFKVRFKQIILENIQAIELRSLDMC